MQYEEEDQLIFFIIIFVIINNPIPLTGINNIRSHLLHYTYLFTYISTYVSAIPVVRRFTPEHVSISKFAFVPWCCD